MLFLGSSLSYVRTGAKFLRCLLCAVGPRSMYLFSLRVGVGVGVRVWGFRRPARGAALFLLASAMLAACTIPPPGGANERPDGADGVRAVDLQPRSPQSSANADTGSGGNRRQLYYGSSGGQATGPAAASPGTDPGPGAGTAPGDGVHLN